MNPAFDKILDDILSKQRLITFMCLFWSFLWIGVDTSQAISAADEPKLYAWVDYKLEVRLVGVQKQLIGQAYYTYHNRSPDTLDYIIFHAWPNAYQAGTPLDQQLMQNGQYRLHRAPPEEQGAMDQLAFQQGNSLLKTQSMDAAGEILRVQLAQPLAPGDSVRLQTPFRVQLPPLYSRMGYEQDRFHITQWYPKPAVYDREGWHPMPYLSQGEFFSPFGSFRVSITLPREMLVAASGALQSPGESAYRNKRDQATRAYLAGARSESRAGLASGQAISAETKTIHFALDSAHDFAWFASATYRYLRDTLQTTASDTGVPLHVYFRAEDETEPWRSAAAVAQRAVSLFEDAVGPYRYPQLSIVSGALPAGGGMEYPGLVQIAGEGTGMERILVHELGHQWFYAMIGSDERAHPWLDEGPTSYLEDRYFRAFADRPVQGVAGLGADQLDAGLQQYYMHRSRKQQDQPVTDSATQYEMGQYFLDVYWRAARSLQYLERYLGRDTFDLGLQRYYQEQRFRLAGSDDLQTALEEVAETDLSWFFEDMLKRSRPRDLQLRRRVEKRNGQVVSRFVLQQDPVLPAPAPVQEEDGSIRWLQFGRDTTLLIRDSQPRQLIVNPGMMMPESRITNNASGWKPRLSFLYRPEQPGIQHIFFLPTPGFNTTDGFLGGLALYNRPIPAPRLQWAALPMYGFRSGRFRGLAGLRARLYQREHPKGRRWWLTGNLGYRNFGYDEVRNPDEGTFLNDFDRYRSGLEYGWETHPNALGKYQILLDAVHIRADRVRATQADDPFEPALAQFEERDTYYRLRFQYRTDQGLSRDITQPKLVEVEAEAHRDWLKLHAALSWFFPYRDADKGFGLRVFGGNVFGPEEAGAFGLSLLNRRGPADYRYDGLLGARAETAGLASRQILGDEGQMRYLPPGAGLARITTEPMLVINMETDLPGIIPFHLFFDLGTYRALDQQPTNESGYSYAGGMSLPLIQDILEIYYPFVRSEDFQQLNTLNNAEWHRNISIRLALHELDILRLPDHLQLPF